MNNKLILGLVVLAILFSGYSAIQVGSLSGKIAQFDRFLPSLGAVGTNTSTVTYSSARGSQELYDNLYAITTDLISLRAPLSNVSSTSVTLDFPSLGVVTSTRTSVTSTAFSGAALGDFVLVSSASGTADVMYDARVVVADNIQIVATNATTSANSIDPGASLFRLRLIPQGTFARPAAILLVSTSTPQN